MVHSVLYVADKDSELRFWHMPLIFIPQAYAFRCSYIFNLFFKIPYFLYSNNFVFVMINYELFTRKLTTRFCWLIYIKCFDEIQLVRNQNRLHYTRTGTIPVLFFFFGYIHSGALISPMFFVL